MRPDPGAPRSGSSGSGSPETRPSDANAGVVALRAALRTLADGHPLGAEEIEAAFAVVTHGDAAAAQIGALLMGLRVRGETADELAGVVRALRRAMVPLPADRPGDLVDTCGTGGGSVTTFNISTVAAFVAAGAGVRVAKHGNRSYTSRCGSADVLEALGVPLDVPVATLVRVLAEAGIVFMFAPSMHPAMRFVAPVRRELGVPTIMNLVGPLANPASAGRQVVGVADPSRLSLVAHALAALGAVHALVVYGEPGLDEVSPLGLTHVAEVPPDGSRERRWTIDPNVYGLGGGTLADLRCGDASLNAEIARELLAGRGPTGARAAVLLNAAAAIYVSGRATIFDDAVAMATDSLSAGCGLAALQRMQAAYTSTA